MFKTSGKPQDGAPWIEVELNDVPPSYHEHAVEELLQRQAPAPQFPEDLPQRRIRQRRLHWLMVGGVMIFTLLLSAVIVLAVLLSLKEQAFSTTPTPELSSISAISTVTAWDTTTVWHTTTTILTQNSTVTQDQYFTISATVSVTATTTSALVQSTSETTDELHVANQFCVLVTAANETTQDTKSNDCLDFCLPGMGLQFCQLPKSQQSERQSSCCNHCGCHA